MMHGVRNSPKAPSLTPSKQEDETADETLYFERSRIKHLQDERVNIQKKTFTKWCNSYLSQARLEIGDLFVDVGDGVMLMKLLEIISGDKLGKPNRGKMRVQKIENLNKVLGFLRKKKIQLENIGAEDILDHNERLILGLIWTIILRFQIDTITIEDEEEAGEKKHAKEALLLWCQRKTAGYHNVRIENFTTSWTNGLAFNALIHAHRPDLIRYENLNPDDHIGNLNNAFDTAEKALEITKLLDAEDVDAARPDEKSIITYVSLYYHYFAKQKTEMTGAKRIANIVSKLMDSERTEVDYEHIASELLQWIRMTTTQLLTVNFPSSLNGMREEHAKFNQFRTTEKPPKYKEKGYLEALFFTLQTKRKAMSRKQYIPPQGLMMHDIETAWNQLDAAENKRQQLIIKELQRQENLEKLAQQFRKKAKLRDTWLRSVSQILEGMVITSSADVQKTIKKQQAITSEIMARENRFKLLSSLCTDLCKEAYHEADSIKSIERDISDRWASLVALLNEKQRALSQLDNLTSLLRDLDTLSSELTVLEPIVCSKDVGKHILGVDDLLEKQDHIDAQISAHGSLLNKLVQTANLYIRQKGESSSVLQRKLDDVSAQYNRLLDFSRGRRQALERARTLYVFLQDYEEEMAWLAETRKICENVVQTGDHSMMPQYSVLFKNTEMEMQSHWARCKKIISTGEKLIQNGQPTNQVQTRLTSMNKAWDQLRNAVTVLGSWINGAKEAQQYFQDCNEAESWMREKLTFVGSEDLGRDTETCEALLQKHTRLEEEIQSYRSEIVRLEEVSTHLATTAVGITVTSQLEEVEELKVPQVEMAYKYEGNGIHVDKGEILALLEKSTGEWWRVLKQNGVEGFVPANYCKIVPNETVTVTQTTTTKKKTTENNENVFTKRQNDISHQYRSLVNKSESRRRNLLDNIKIWKFQRLCDDFVEWASGVESILREEPDIAHIEAFRRRFDNLSADMSATGKSLLGAAKANGDKLLAEGHLQAALIKKRNNEIGNKWELLNRLQNEQRDKLEACERVSDFNNICESARDWMNSKYNQLEGHPTNVRSLQNLERDLKPLAEKIAHLENLAKAVRKDHPSKAQEIENQLAGLKKLYGDLVNNTQRKVAMAEQMQGLEIFLSATKEVTVWIEDTVKQLTAEVSSVDVDEAEELLKKHEDLGEKIRNKQYEVDYCYELGNRLLERNKRCPEVEEPLKRLKTDMSTILGLYGNRSNLLKQQLDLQLFNREAGRIDAITKGHEVVLEYNDLGDSVEAVESMIKRHRDLEDKLRAQEPRLDAFSKAADDLMRAKHDNSAYIDKRRKDVILKRDNVKKLAGDRKKNLFNALEYQEWRSEINEFINWIQEKRHALNDSYKISTTNNVEQQLQKHDAFAAEIHANVGRKEEIDSVAAALISKGNVDKVTIERLLILENTEWSNLLDELDMKKKQLQKKGHDKALDSVLKDLNLKLVEMETSLNSPDNGSDLRSAQKLLQDHGVVEQEINIYYDNLRDLESRALTDQNKSAISQSKDRYDAVYQLAAARKKGLQESLVWHQLCFDIDCQLLWIGEKTTIARRSEKVRNLTDSMNILKKQEQLNTEVKQHEEEVQQLVKSADKLCLASHNLTPLIRKKKEELLNSMQTLNACMAERQRFVENAVKVQQYLSDTNELELRMNETFEVLKSEDYGSDEETSRKLMTKDKAVIADLQGYRKWLSQLADTLREIVVATGNEQLNERQKDLELKLDDLFKLAEVRQRALEDTLLLHGYLRDSSELEDWINAQLQVAMSEDYAEDYEHLQELKANFEEFKQSVKTGSERFVICEETVSNILRRNPPFARDILKKQEKLRSVWTLLLDYIESREIKLGAAEELHKFNRDVFEFRQFIAEKLHNMPKDLGRNVNNVHSLIQKHDALEKEVHIAEKRLQVLIEEANRLKQLYPGENEKHIEEEQKATIDEWEILNERLIERKHLLANACDLHGFNASIRDLLAWIDLTVSDIQSDIHINDLQQAEWLQQEHDRVLKEIKAREPECAELIKNGEEMCASRNYAAQEIQVKVNLIKKAFVELKREWELRNDFLAQSVQWHAFARESKQIIALIVSKRTTLRSFQIGTTVTELEAQLDRLITFEKALATVEDRIGALDQTASQLMQRNHIEKNNISALRQKVHDDLNLLLSDIESRRALLMHMLQMAKFNEELNDSERWIEEKLAVFGRSKGLSGEEITNEEKMKRLQKHQAQEAEISANQVIFDQLLQKVSDFCHLKGTDELKTRSQVVTKKWNTLLAVSAEQYKALEEARDLLAFKQTINRLEDWINEKEVLVACKDLGRDYEHCRLLLTKLDNAKGSIDENTLQEANRLGDKLIQQNTSEKEYVLGNLNALNKRWNALEGQIDEYRVNLSAALEVHSFNKEVDETNERIQEKILMMKNEDYGKDFASTDILLRKHANLEREMSAIHKKLIQHEQEAQRLFDVQPVLQTTVVESLNKLEKSWGDLSDASKFRSTRLNEKYRLFKYFDDVKKTEIWMNQIRNRITLRRSPCNTEEAKLILDELQEIKAEIDGRQEELQKIYENGQTLIAEQPSHKAEIQRNHKRVQLVEHQLRQTWEVEKASIQKLLEWQTWADEANQTERWLADKENLISQGDLGDNCDAVDMLIKTQIGLKKTIESYGEQVAKLMQKADALVASGNDGRSEFLDSKDAIAERYNDLLKKTDNRHALLNDSKRYHEFIRKCGELVIWITAKLQMAYDESFLDHSNLRSKLQKHLAFDSELTENEKRLIGVEEEGENMLQQKHFMSEQIRIQLEELRSGWEELKQKSGLKSKRLRGAYETNLLKRKLEENEEWLDKMEMELSSENHGKDLPSVEALIKKVDNLKNEIGGREQNVEELVRKARELTTSEATDDFLKHAEQLEHRYSSLKEPVEIREANLNDAKKMFIWSREAEEHFEWFSDKAHLISLNDIGENQQVLLGQQKKHSQLEKELDSRESSIRDTCNKGLHMIQEKHFAARSIENVIHRLNADLGNFKESCALRRDLIQESMKAQEYLTDVTEAEQWIHEQMPLASSQEIGRDQMGAESNLRRLAALEKDIESYRADISNLRKRADKFVSEGHSFSSAIGTKQEFVEQLFSNLIAEARRRHTRLDDASKYFQFVTFADNLFDWLREREAVCCDEDYGRDLDDCLQITEKFETTVRELVSAGERVSVVQKMQEELLRSGHSYAASITAKGADIQRLWSRVNQAANERKMALGGARQVHQFDQDADQMLNWLQEKEALEVAMEQEDLSKCDFASVKAQIERHDEFSHGMKAVEKQVADLCYEAERLCQNYPDTRPHLEVRKLDMTEQLKDILKAASAHSDKLGQLSNLQSFFQEYNEMIQWIKCMQTTITSEALPRDVLACNALAKRHAGYMIEIQGRRPQYEEFCLNGRRMINGKNVLSSEIQEKVTTLESAWRVLSEVWNDRRELYEENMDCQQWKANASQLESWLLEKERVLGDDYKMIDSVDAADAHLRQFDDFLVTLEALDDKCELVKKLTLIEKNFSELRKKEVDRVNVAQEESRRRDTIKILEKKDILAGRRMERERRKTQEISLLINTPVEEKKSLQETVNYTLPRTDKSKKVEVLAMAKEAPVVPLEPVKVPSFNTRLNPVAKKKREDHGIIDMQGFIDRKQCLQAGGKRATIRSWKNYYSILCGQLMCFFKDENNFKDNLASAPPLNIYGAKCEQFNEYVKRKNAFRLCTQDGSDYVFVCETESTMLEWVAKIQFHAALSPADQLTSYNPHREFALDKLSPNAPTMNLLVGLEARPESFEQTSGMNSLAYQEHTTLRFEPQLKRTVLTEATEFVSWVEEQDEKNPPACPSPSSSFSSVNTQNNDENGSTKSSKRKAFSIFKRSSKANKF